MLNSMARCALSLVFAAAVSGCGGSGSADSDDAEPAPSPAPAPPAGGSPRWFPAAADTWQWQIKGTIDTRLAVTVYDIDLFDAPQTTIDSLKAQGRRVVCYFSAGSSENWRDDFARFDTADMGNALDGWPGERWLDTRSANVRAIMQSRLDLAVTKGCDGVEPDNMDGYQNTPGFALSAATQLDYNRFIARESHARGLAVGLKNDLKQVKDLLPSFDFAVNEQCVRYNECERLTPFINANKPVFGIEYNGVAADVCAEANRLNFDTLLKRLKLDARRQSCR